MGKDITEAQFVEAKTEPPPNWLKIGLFLVLGLVLAGYLIFAGHKHKLGQRQTLPEVTKRPIPVPSITPLRTLISQPTVNWETYVNAAGGYQIKHPPGWFVWEDTSYTSISNYDINKAPGRGYVPELDKGKFKVEIYITEKPKSLSLGDWLRDQETTMITKVKSKMPVVINGINGIRVESEGIFGPSAVVYLENREEARVFQIAAALDYLNNKSTFDLVVSTFEFIESEISEVRELIDKFEAAYRAKDAKSPLFTYMTEPATQEEKDLSSVLYQGKDTKGNPGGPVLFEGSAGAVVTDYQIQEIKKSDEGYQVKIEENYTYRNNVTGRKERGERVSIAEVVKVEGRWLIDAYYTEGYPKSKYGGFGG